MRKLATVVLAVVIAAAARADDLERLRRLLAQQDYEAVVHEPEPATPEGRAIRVWALYATLAPDRAEAEAAAMQRDAPDDPWTWAIRTSVLSNELGRSAEALAATEKMLAAAPQPVPERMLRMRATALANAARFDEAGALLEKAPRTPLLIVERANHLANESYRKKKPELVDEAIAMLEEARRTYPEDVLIRSTLGRILGRTRRQYDKSLELWREAAALTPAVSVHGGLWGAIAAQRDVTAEQKNEAIRKDIDALLAARGTWPEVRLAVARQYREMKLLDPARELEEAILRDAPASPQAGLVLYSRWSAFAKDAGPIAKQSPETRAESRRLLRTVIDYPHAGPARVASAYESLFFLMRDDRSVPDKELLEAVHGMEPRGDDEPDQVYLAGAQALADRRLELDYAAELVRKATAAMPRILDDQKSYGDDPADVAKATAFVTAAMHDAAGWVALQRGRYAEAQKELLAAYDQRHDDPLVLYHLGQYYERRGAVTKAEDHYRKGALLQAAAGNRNPDALKALYQKRHGSLAGYDAYFRSLTDKDTIARRKKILDARLKTPKPAPAFALKTLDGGKRSLDDLRGKVAIINFWGVWCSWCVREMPDYQELAKKYAHDPKVAVLTINNDPDLDKVREWMKKHQYDFDVLIDDGFVARQQLFAFPTTWFLDPKGRLAFEKKGWSEKLVEEFSWRIDALKE